MEQAQLERLLIRARFLFNRAAVVRLGLRDLPSIQANADMFVRECHRVYKQAQALLIDGMLEIESELTRITGTSDPESSQVGRYNHWLRILESCYESFLWLAFRPCDIPHLYKGPKFGSLADQNIDSVLGVMRKLNESPYALAVPLDFTRFSCTGDLLHIERDPGSGPRTSVIEVKEGPVNDAILNAVEAREEGTWAQFFDDYGKKGFEQARRFFKQNREYFKRADRMKATAGFHEDEDGPRVVLESDIPLESYHDVVQALCNRARKGEYAVDVVDGCVAIAAVDTTAKQRSMLGEFDARLFVFNAFAETEPVSKLSPAEISAGLQRISLTDWLEGLASIGLAPLFMRPLRARDFLDLALGRVRLRFFFHAPNFVDLCRRSGVQAGFLTRKETNRLRSQEKWHDGDYPLYKGKAITYQIGGSQGIFGSLRLHEILFNWVRPLSIVKLIADANAKPETLAAGQPRAAL